MSESTSQSIGTVLVVDDSPEFQFLVSLALKAEGYSIAQATDGQEALDYLRSHQLPLAIVLDIRMPKMSGQEFRVEQEKDERLKQVPVVIYSSESDMRSLAREMHVDSFVSKIESPSRIVEEVKRSSRRGSMLAGHGGPHDA